jgi:hypothetical protein
MQQKRGRPKAKIETEQVAVRLPKMMLKYLRPHVSKEIRERLARSLFDDSRDQSLRKLEAKIERLATEVRQATGFEWRADSYSHQVFVEVLRLLIADLPVPEAREAKLNVEPAQAAALIYTRYTNDVRELEQKRKINPRIPLSHLLEGMNDE